MAFAQPAILTEPVVLSKCLLADAVSSALMHGCLRWRAA